MARVKASARPRPGDLIISRHPEHSIGVYENREMFDDICDSIGYHDITFVIGSFTVRTKIKKSLTTKLFVLTHNNRLGWINAKYVNRLT